MSKARHEEIMEIMGSEPDSVADTLVAWETELSKVMPPDYKDWWKNDRREWPLVARKTIENLREREKLAWEQINRKEKQ